MKRHQIKRLLKESGFELAKQGKKHAIYQKNDLRITMSQGSKHTERFIAEMLVKIRKAQNGI